MSSSRQVAGKKARISATCAEEWDVRVREAAKDSEAEGRVNEAKVKGRTRRREW